MNIKTIVRNQYNSGYGRSNVPYDCHYNFTQLYCNYSQTSEIDLLFGTTEQIWKCQDTLI